MKSLFKAYTTFTRREQMGLVGLLVILALLLGIRATMHFWVPAPDEKDQEKLVKAWQQFKASQVEAPVSPVGTDTVKKQEIVVSNKRSTAATNLFPFDPNTIDSPGLRKLGLREKTVSILLHWRAKGKVFYKKEELRKLYTLSEDEYTRLEPYIIIKQHK